MIETTITKIQYDADGVQRRWSIPFQYADAKHISIYTKVGEEPTVKVVDNYDIDEDDSVVIYPTIASGQEPVAAGTKIIIARETPETQLEDASQVHFTSKDVERGLDKLTMITQELSTTAGETMEVSADAFEAAEEAVSTANEANATAGEAKTLAEQAVSVANDANATSTAANTKSDTAIKTANDANEKSTAAVSTANTAKTVADEANSTANKANATATEAKEIAAVANTTANNADKIANEADKKADNAVIIANNAKDIADGIDAKATQALDNSNTAVNTANSAKQIAEGINDKATQALANSTTALETATQAKNTADSYQGQITTLRNDIDDLGDQLAGYLPMASKAVANGVASLDANAKVPSEQIPVAAASALGGVKPDGTTITVTEDGTISAVTPSIDLPSDVYTQSNLLAGKNITIEEVLPEGGIDEHTLACWHFDEDLEPIKLDSQLTSDVRGTIKQDYYKFGNGSCSGPDITIMNRGLNTSDFTVDYFFMPKDYLGGKNTYIGDVKIYINGLGVIVYFNNNKIYEFSLEQYGIWTHFAIRRKDLIYTIYVNGQSIFQSTEALTTRPATLFEAVTGGSIYFYIDELRISDIARQLTTDGKFPVPTQAYSVAEPTGKVAINNTITKTSQLTNDSGFITDVPVATTSTLGGVKPDGDTITVTEDGTISSVGGSGSGFDFEGTKAEFDAAVAAGTITEDSVSLITDDVSGDNVATKAELQNKVSKAGDTMTGPLKISGANEVRFGNDDNYYYLKHNNAGNFDFNIIKDGKIYGVFLDKYDNYALHYRKDQEFYRLLTTADQENLQTQINSLNTEVTGMLGRMNFNAGVSTGGKSYVCPSDGYLFFVKSASSSTPIDLKINNISIGSIRSTSSTFVPTVGMVPVSKDDIFGSSDSNLVFTFVPQK